MKAKIVTDYLGFRDLKGEWSALTGGAGAALLPLSWEWFDAWWHAFGVPLEAESGSAPEIATFQDSGGLLAVIPLLRLSRGWSDLWGGTRRTMSNGTSPFWDGIFRTGMAATDLDSICETLFHEPGQQKILLERISQDSPIRRWLIRGLLARVDYDMLRTPIVRCDVPWEDYLHGLERKFRKDLRKKLRDFEATPGASVERIEVKRGSDAIFAEMIAISRNSWKRRLGTDLTSNGQALRFLERLVENVADSRPACVWIARVGEWPVAFELHVRDGSTTYSIRADIDERAAKLAPGSVVEHHALAAAFADPTLDVYDTCAADYRYLRNLTQDRRNSYTTKVFTDGLRSAILYGIEARAKPVYRSLRAVIRRPEPFPAGPRAR